MAIVNAPQPRLADEQLISHPWTGRILSPRRCRHCPSLRPLGTDAVQLDAAQVDPSGRIHIRRLIDALGWRPGQQVSLDVIDGIVVIRLDPAGRSALGTRGTLVLPAAIRQMAGIDRGATVIAAADPAVPALFVHPQHTVACS